MITKIYTQLFAGFFIGQLGGDQIQIVNSSWIKLFELKTTIMESRELSRARPATTQDEIKKLSILYDRLLELIDRGMNILEATRDVCDTAPFV